MCESLLSSHPHLHSHDVEEEEEAGKIVNIISLSLRTNRATDRFSSSGFRPSQSSGWDPPPAYTQFVTILQINSRQITCNAFVSDRDREIQLEIHQITASNRRTTDHRLTLGAVHVCDYMTHLIVELACLRVIWKLLAVEEISPQRDNSRTDRHSPHSPCVWIQQSISFTASYDTNMTVFLLPVYRQ